MRVKMIRTVELAAGGWDCWCIEVSIADTRIESASDGTTPFLTMLVSSSPDIVGKETENRG